jgi:hypothetical protein
MRAEKLSPSWNGFSSSLPIVSGIRKPRARNWYPNSLRAGMVVWHMEQLALYFRASPRHPGFAAYVSREALKVRAADDEGFLRLS